MNLVRRNGRMMKQIFVTGKFGPNESWIDCGPAPPLTRRDRAMQVMDYFEKKERTSSEWYKIAQRISIKEVFNHEFNVTGCQSGRFCGTGEPNIPASDPNIMSRVQGPGYTTARNQ